MSKTNEKIYFSPNLSERERGCFEAGIKLGALYHILCGIPVRSDENVINSLEKGIEAAISCQPYVKSVKIVLDRNKILRNKTTEFDYDEITGNMIQAEIIIEYESVFITAKIEWMEEMEYPLMFIEKIHEKN